MSPSDAEAEEAARAICARQLESRPRTRHELESALHRKGISGETCETVLARFAEVGLVDDAAFARAWVESRHASHHLGRRALAFELRKKGVGHHQIEDALSEVDATSEWSAADAIVRRKIRSLPDGVSDAVAFRRLAGALARKGFPAEMSREVIRAAMGADEDS